MKELSKVQSKFYNITKLIEILGILSSNFGRTYIITR